MRTTISWGDAIVGTRVGCKVRHHGRSVSEEFFRVRLRFSAVFDTVLSGDYPSWCVNWAIQGVEAYVFLEPVQGVAALALLAEHSD